MEDGRGAGWVGVGGRVPFFPPFSQIQILWFSSASIEEEGTWPDECTLNFNFASEQ